MKLEKYQLNKINELQLQLTDLPRFKDLGQKVNETKATSKILDSELRALQKKNLSMF